MFIYIYVMSLFGLALAVVHDWTFYGSNLLAQDLTDYSYL